MGNEATIDLKADTQQLTEGFQAGEVDAKKFAQTFEQTFQVADKAADDFSQELQKVTEHLHQLFASQQQFPVATAGVTQAIEQETNALSSLLGVVKEYIITSAVITGASKAYTSATTKGAAINTVAATSFTEIGSAIAAATVDIGVAAVTAGKLGVVMAALAAAAKAFAIAAEHTGTRIKVMDDRLVESQKLVNMAAGDINKMRIILDELGISAEEAGIKVETNLSRIQDSFERAKNKITKGTDDALKEATSSWDRFWITFRVNADAEVTAVSDTIKATTDHVSNAVDEMRGKFAAWIMNQTEADRQVWESHKETMRKIEQAEKASKVLEIQRAMHAAELKDFNDYANKRIQSARETILVENAMSENSIRRINERVEALRKERLELTLTGKLRAGQLEEFRTKEDALLSRQQAMLANIREMQRELREAGGQKAEDRKKQEAEDIKHNQAIQVAGMGQLLSMLEDEKDLRQELAHGDFDDDKKLADAKAVNAQKIAAIEQAIRNKRQADNEAQMDIDMRAAGNVVDLERQHRQLDNALDDADRATEHEKTMRALEVQGASLKKIHDLKMKFINDEEQQQLSRLEVRDPVQIERIQAEAIKQRIREVAEFEQQKREDVREVQRLVDAEQRRKEDEAFDKSNASEKERSDFRINRLREEAREAENAAHTDAEMLRIKLNLEVAIREENQRILELKKAGVNVMAKQNQQMPRNRKEELAMIKQNREDQKQQMKEAIAAKNKAILDKGIAERQAKSKKKSEQQEKVAQLLRNRDRAKMLARKASSARRTQVDNTDFLDKFKQDKNDIKTDRREDDNNKELHIIAKASDRTAQAVERMSRALENVGALT